MTIQSPHTHGSGTQVVQDSGHQVCVLPLVEGSLHSLERNQRQERQVLGCGQHHRSLHSCNLITASYTTCKALKLSVPSTQPHHRAVLYPCSCSLRAADGSPANIPWKIFFRKCWLEELLCSQHRSCWRNAGFFLLLVGLRPSQRMAAYVSVSLVWAEELAATNTATGH